MSGFSHRSFGSSSMSLPGPLGARLTCGCPLCLLWRRLGEEVHLRHSSSIFQDKAVEVLRVAFDQLVDYREVHGLQLWGDLGRGPSRQRRPLPRLRGDKEKEKPSVKEPKEKRRSREQRSPRSRSRRRPTSKRTRTSSHRPRESQASHPSEKSKVRDSSSSSRRPSIKEELSEKEKNKAY